MPQDLKAKVKKIIGQNIKAAREHAKISQEELKKYVGVQTQGAVGHWERGLKLIPCDKLFMVAEYLGISPAALIDPAYKPGSGGVVSVDDPHAELIKKALCVLRSNTHFVASLEQNIESFYLGVQRENKDKDDIRQEAKAAAREEVRRLISGGVAEHVDGAPFVKPGRKGPSLPRQKHVKAKE